MKIDYLDHLVLTVKNIATTCEFYASVLGMEFITFRKNRKVLLFDSQKINLCWQHCQNDDNWMKKIIVADLQKAYDGRWCSEVS